jgi:hypothetical protein
MSEGYDGIYFSKFWLSSEKDCVPDTVFSHSHTTTDVWDDLGGSAVDADANFYALDRASAHGAPTYHHYYLGFWGTCD